MLVTSHVAESGEKWLGKPLTRDHKPNVKAGLQPFSHKTAFSFSLARGNLKESRRQVPRLFLGNSEGWNSCHIALEVDPPPPINKNLTGPVLLFVEFRHV